MIRKEMAILSRNGSDGNSNFRATGTGIVIRTAIQAALAVVFFQKIPKTNRAVMPGLTRPVYSWMNWKTWFMPVSVDAREAARIMMMKLDMRPVVPSLPEAVAEMYPEYVDCKCGGCALTVGMTEQWLRSCRKPYPMPEAQTAKSQDRLIGPGDICMRYKNRNPGMTTRSGMIISVPEDHLVGKLI
jgi:hypothetical protein